MPGTLLWTVSSATVLEFVNHVLSERMRPEFARIISTSNVIDSGPYPAVLLARCDGGWELCGYIKPDGPGIFGRGVTRLGSAFSILLGMTDKVKELEAALATLAACTAVTLIEVGEGEEEEEEVDCIIR